MEEKQAIKRLKEGDLTGLKSLVEEHQVRSVRAAFLIVKDRSTAEGLVQEAFLKAARKIAQFDDSCPFSPWFYRIVVNDALKYIKKQERFVSLDDELEKPYHQLANRLAVGERSPELLLEIRQKRQEIIRAIHSLPPDRRAAVVMFYYLDMSMKEMVQKTERPLSTVKWWLRDARKRLKKELQRTAGN